MRIISADARLAERNGPKVLIAGPAKIGKTSLLRTLPPSLLARTLFVDIEAGDLSVRDVPVASVRPDEGEHWTWSDCVDIACLLGGPNPGHNEALPYNPAHYARVIEKLGGQVSADDFDLYFIDSITVASQLCLTWAAQQPEAFNKDGKPDTRGMYGLCGRQLVMWLNQLQHARQKGVVYVCILEQQEDDYGRKAWGLQIAGGMAGRALPGIVDEIITMQLVQQDEDVAAERFFVCKQDNPAKYPAGDRSGRLAMLEPPDLGALIAKLTAPLAEVAPVPAKKRA